MYKKDEEIYEKIIEWFYVAIAVFIFCGITCFLYSIHSPEKYYKIFYLFFIVFVGSGSTMLSVILLSIIPDFIEKIINLIRQNFYVWKFNYIYKNVKLSFGKNADISFGRKYIKAYIQTKDELLELIINKINKETLINISEKYGIKIHHLELIFITAESTYSIKSHITFEEYEVMQTVLKKHNEKYKNLGVQFDYKLSDSRYFTYICINTINKSVVLYLDEFSRMNFNPQSIKPILFNFKIKEEDFMEIAKHSIFNQIDRLARWNRDYASYYNRGSV